MKLFDSYGKKKLPTTKCTQEKRQRNNTDVIEYLLELDVLDEVTKSNVIYMAQKEAESAFFTLSVLYAWQSLHTGTFCVFARINFEYINIYVNVLRDGIIHLGVCDSVSIDEFYACEKDEFFSNLHHLNNTVDINEEIKSNIWKALVHKFPEHSSEEPIRTVIFEKYLPYSLENLVGANQYSNSGILYKMLEPLSPKHKNLIEMQKWLVSNKGEESETRNYIKSSYFAPFPQTEEEFLSYVQSNFNTEVVTLLSAIPHKTVFVDDKSSMNSGSMLFEAEYRELHIYKSITDTSILVLKIYSVYNGRPQEGGRMEGYIFEKTIKIPSEEYYWSDVELIAKYQSYFKQ